MDLVLSHHKDVPDALKRLVREGLISEEQYDALSKEDELNLDKVISKSKLPRSVVGSIFYQEKHLIC